MEASVSSIRGLIQNGKLLRIPYFQRSYVWGEEDWERFAKDMEATIDSARDYFLGAVILKNEQQLDGDGANGIEQRCMVVDGQQRLTTLNIYMKVLFSLAGKTDDFRFQYLRDTGAQEPVLEHSREDRAMFSMVMNKDVLGKIEDDSSNIIKVYNYFFTRLSQHRENVTYLRSLINTINAHIRFVVITLNFTDDEQQIFDTINSLGVPLTTCDLVKNFLYGPNDEQAYNDNWKMVFEGTKETRDFWNTDASKSRQAKTKDNTTIERFFHAFVRVKMWDFKNQLTDAQKKNFVKLSNVFSTCKAFVEDFNMSKQDLANEIIVYAKLFREYLGDDILDNENMPRYGGIKRISCYINATKQYSVIPYVLYILRNVDSESERNCIFTYLETYLVRRILSESENKSYSDLFTENLIGNGIRTFEDLKNFISQREDSNLAMPGNGKIKLSINSRKKGLGESMAKIVLFLYETKLENNTINKSFNDFYAQMLMPKNRNANQDNWPQHRRDTNAENERIMLMTTIGNYFLLDSAAKNTLKKMEDERCSIKVGEMRNWSDSIRSNQILVDTATNNSISEWNSDSIKSRNKGLADIFCNHIWTL